MSSITSELSSSTMDNSKATLNMENEIILQNNSSDVTISKFECSTTISTTVPTSNSITMKTLPVVYIQTPFTTINKNNSNLINVNNVPQFQFTTLGQNSTPKQQNVILAPMNTGKQLLIQKQNVVPILPATTTKVSGLNLGMLKTVKSTEQSQDCSQKYVLSRLPITAKNNVIKPKVPILPAPIKSQEQIPPTPAKIINFKFVDGELQRDNNVVVCDNSNQENDNSDVESSILCDEIMDDSPVKLEKGFDLNNKIPGILKESVKFPKHGISILKKNYSFSERKPDKVEPKEEVIVNDVSVSEETITVPDIKATQKSERRRKSNFSYRKDYDDLEISTVSDNSFDKTASKKIDMTSVCEIKVKDETKPDVDINMNADLVFESMLQWEDGIGSLPGSGLKFFKNEFELIEFVTDEEYLKMRPKKLQKEKSDYQEEMRCLECGCYGLPSEFINPKFCSNACQEASNNKLPKIKRKRRRGWGKKTDSDNNKDQNSDDDEEDVSNENSQDKYAYPWACGKKGFSWSKYLDHMKAKPSPVKLFKDPFPYTRNGFRPGMKLEGVDPQHPACFCVMSVAEVNGYRIRLHFDGYPDNYDFWCNADSMDIFPMGWCEKYGHVLQPPPGYTVDNFNWLQYLKVTKSTAAPKHLFCNRAGNAICPNGFRVGMKLEAVDRKNTSLVCVATVRDMMDNRILVHFDSWDDIYDYWADPTSPYIHPVGWCDQYGHNLTPPNDYPNPESFTWEAYLKETKSVAAPVRAFKQRAACGFKKGMRLECVDKRVPQLIRVATVDDVKGHQLRIRFDGWPDRYSYWVDDDSPDIHPVGWCQKTGHPIEPPLTPDDVYDFLECPTVGCRGQGDIRGPKYLTHSTQKYCPYAEENIDADKVLPDRLLSPDRTLEAVIPVSREPREKPRNKVGRPPKNRPKIEPVDEVVEPKPKRKYRKRIKLEPTESAEEKAISFIEESNITPVEKEVFHKHTKFLREFVTENMDARTWDCQEVRQFVSSIPDCRSYSDIFLDEDIDGESLLALSQKDMVSILKIKLGPAIKLYNSVLLLRQHTNNQMYE